MRVEDSNTPPPSSPINTATTPSNEKERPAIFLRYLSLSLLVVQNCTAVLLMRHSQTRPHVPFAVTSVIIVTEFVKLFLCLFLRARQVGLTTAVHEAGTIELWRMAIPAGLFTLQNNVLFIALANLEATLFQVTYQLKVLITALLMVLMLGKRLTRLKWFSLVLLFVGIVLTQLNAKGSSKVEVSSQSLLVGLTAVVVSASSSGFASVYFEKLVKAPAASLLTRNVQLAGFSIVLTFATYLFFDRRSLEDFFNGYDFVVVSLVAVQAAGGLLVAMVIKYADNILKGFATALAIICSGVISFMWLEFAPTITFLSGVMLVISATGIYSLPDAPTKEPDSRA